jgi:retron-type reverse transcriptase
MKRYGNLFAQVIDFANLLSAANKAMRGHKNKRAVAHFNFHLENELIALQTELSTNTYQPHPYHTFTIYEPKPRLICAAPIRDRVVHHAICNVVGEIFEATLINHTYACRVGKGQFAAINRAQDFSRRYEFYLQCDVRKYFASIDRAVLKKLIRRKIKDAKLLSLIDTIIDQPLKGSVEGKGLPIGNLTSQHFANFYLSKLDHFIKEQLGVKGCVRYMDDFLLFDNSKETLHEIKAEIDKFLSEQLALKLKENPILAPCRSGFSFLGFRIYPATLRLTGKKWKRFRKRVQNKEKDFIEGLIDEQELNNSIQSMVAHIAKADTLEARRKFFSNSIIRNSF